LEYLKNAFENEENVECKIKEVVKGGVAAYLGEIRGFIPTSQLSVKYVENLNEFVDRKLEVRIIDINEAKNNIVLSRKKVEEVELEEKKNDTLNKIKPGDKVKGKVTKLMKFGAFVDLGGVEGLIHISELSWERVKNPSDVVSIGDEVEVYILDIDRGKSRISLSLKDITPNPWDNIDKKYKIDDIIKGKIVKIINIGAFVQIEPGVEGLVHVSEISDEHIAKPEDVLQVGNNVNVKILSIDSNAKKISLSIKDAENTSKEDYSEYTNNSEEGFSIGEVFNGKLKNLKLN
jgi:Ribosomal protein S1